MHPTLIGALFSATIAVGVFVFSQILAASRDQSALRKEKLEELVLSLREILHVMRPSRKPKDTLNILLESTNATSKPEFLVRLYFPDLEPFFREIQKSLVPILQRLRQDQLLDQAPSLSPADVNPLSKTVTDLTNHIVYNSTALTRGFLGRFWQNVWT